MRRREFVQLVAGTAIALPFAAAARAATKSFRLAILASGPAAPADSPLGKVILTALAEHGYKLGRNLEMQAFGANAELARLPQLARAIAAGKFDAAIVVGWPSAAAMKDTGVPTVVALGAGDPVASGLVTSLARPGGSITGISDNAATLSAKRLDLLKQAVPQIRKVAMLWNKDDLGMTLRYKASAEAAKILGTAVEPYGIAEPDDFGDAFAAMDRDKPDAILMVADALTSLNRKRVFEYADAKRVPAIYENDLFVRDGGLMSYGADIKESLARAASLVDRIFRGAKPADLPFEEPSRYVFAINLKAAKVIDLHLPATVLALADEVIE
jgi:putative tryptophan/tyrosine transport system substrate-binding protein